MKKFVCGMILFLMNFFAFGNVSAEEKIQPEEVTPIAEETQPEEKVLAAEEKSDVKKNFELQLEYLSGMAFTSRNVNNYNVHLFQKIHEQHAMSIYRGLTFTRAVGATNPRGEGIWLDSEGVAIGPGMQVRFEKKVSGKFHLAWDFAGSLMFYNKAHPAEGRAYGFLWRTGPRLIWQSRKNDAISLGYYISHFSNGMRTHNPGYNTLGFSLGINHQF